MRNQRQFLAGLGYATDTGVRGRLGFKYHWLNERGHSLNTELRASRIKHGLGVNYEIPGSDPVNDTYALHALYRREDSDVKDTTTYVAGGSWTKKLGKLWERRLSLDYGIEQYEDDDERTSKLLLPGISFVRLAVDDPLNVTRGSRLELKLRGSHQDLLSDVSLLQPRIDGKLVWSFAPRHRLIGRADLGTTSVSNFSKLPSSLRFYAGGDNSVRGYELDKISPVNDNGEEVGGKHLITGSLEYEYRLFDQWGVAAFVDAGDAFNDDPDLKTGIGLGLRWYTPIGPVRVDVAHALDRTPGDMIRLHIRIGPEL
jgi:translocation and assembly module TamA